MMETRERSELQSRPAGTSLSTVFLRKSNVVVFTCLQKNSFKNTVGKGEIAHNEQFLLFPTVFSTVMENSLPFSSNLKFSSANSFSLDESNICHLGKR